MGQGCHQTQVGSRVMTAAKRRLADSHHFGGVPPNDVVDHPRSAPACSVAIAPSVRPERLTTSTGTQRSRVSGAPSTARRLDVTAVSPGQRPGRGTMASLNSRPDRRDRLSSADGCGLCVVCCPQATPLTESRKPLLTCMFTLVGWGRFELPTSASRTKFIRTTVDLSERTWQVSADFRTPANGSERLRSRDIRAMSRLSTLRSDRRGQPVR